ncbi:hypothetical protein DM02DRAFT_722997 [Periconia macrospinosa]|uniref:Uncharacterized protein n=1 Tax=Periconia macrospinosa TaxID=97972 RepID=A0A2V1EFS2_9PLEO|nr:hypothetical protein DM02DRAFT_722997 [Periconia macrospinosa]
MSGPKNQDEVTDLKKQYNEIASKYWEVNRKYSKLSGQDIWEVQEKRKQLEAMCKTWHDFEKTNNDLEKFAEDIHKRVEDNKKKQKKVAAAAHLDDLHDALQGKPELLQAKFPWMEGYIPSKQLDASNDDHDHHDDNHGDEMVMDRAEKPEKTAKKRKIENAISGTDAETSKFEAKNAATKTKVASKCENCKRKKNKKRKIKDINYPLQIAGLSNTVYEQAAILVIKDLPRIENAGVLSMDTSEVTSFNRVLGQVHEDMIGTLGNLED